MVDNGSPLVSGWPRRARTLLLRGMMAAAMIVTAVGAPTAASADDGDRVTTTSCGSLQAPESGTAHARFRNCTISWGKNIIDGAYWQTVKFQLLDARTDGYCARAIVEVTRVNGSYEDRTFSECNGVWTNKSVTFSGRGRLMWFALGYGPAPYNLNGTNIVQFTSPGGY
jgi:hypothetical protein